MKRVNPNDRQQEYCRYKTTKHDSPSSAFDLKPIAYASHIHSFFLPSWAFNWKHWHSKKDFSTLEWKKKST